MILPEPNRLGRIRRSKKRPPFSSCRRATRSAIELLQHDAFGLEYRWLQKSFFQLLRLGETLAHDAVDGSALKNEVAVIPLTVPVESPFRARWRRMMVAAEVVLIVTPEALELTTGCAASRQFLTHLLLQQKLPPKSQRNRLLYSW